MIVLAVDTSMTSGTVGIVYFNDDNDHDAVLYESVIQRVDTHNKRLLPEVDRALKATGLNLKDVDLFCVGVGPGSFTGLRISVTTVKCLAWSLNKPVVGVPSLDALAVPFAWSPLSVCPLIDARKKEVYWTVFKCNGTGTLNRICDYMVSPPEEIFNTSVLDGPTIFCGDGRKVFRSFLIKTGSQLAREAPPIFDSVRASSIAFLGYRRFRRGNVDDPLTLVPLYVRPSEAEIKNPNIRIPG